MVQTFNQLSIERAQIDTEFYTQHNGLISFLKEHFYLFAIMRTKFKLVLNTFLGVFYKYQFLTLCHRGHQEVAKNLKS
jgi:hypothetical protein